MIAALSRSVGWRLTAVVAVALLIAGSMSAPSGGEVVKRPALVSTPVAAVPEARDAADEDEEVSPVAAPVRIVIPAIDVDAGIVPVGLMPDGAMEVPDFGVAGDYKHGPRPGDPGPAVIAGHVDSYNGPDIFYRLQEVEAGDEIHVHTADGDVLTFVAEDKEMTHKDELPVDRIWNDTEEPVLRLITCGGAFDSSIRHYTHNWTVYASMAST